MDNRTLALVGGILLIVGWLLANVLAVSSWFWVVAVAGLSALCLAGFRQFGKK